MASGASKKLCYATKQDLIRLCEGDDVDITDRDGKPLLLPFLLARVYLGNAGVTSINTKAERWFGRVLKKNKDGIRDSAKKIIPPDQHQGLEKLEKDELCKAVAVILASWNEENNLGTAVEGLGLDSDASEGSISAGDEPKVAFGEGSGSDCHPVDFTFKKAKGISFAERGRAQAEKAKRHRGSVSSQSFHSDAHDNKKAKNAGSYAAVDEDASPASRPGIHFNDAFHMDDTPGPPITKNDLDQVVHRVGCQITKFIFDDDIVQKMMLRMGRKWVENENATKPSAEPAEAQNLRDILTIQELREEIRDLQEQDDDHRVALGEEQQAHAKTKKELQTVVRLTLRALVELREKGAETQVIIGDLEAQIMRMK